MHSTASTPRSRSAAWRRQPLLAVLLAGLFASGAAQAFDFGHARLVSGSGQPLQADVAIVRLTPQEQADLQVRVAPADAWAQVGLTPPVDLASLRVQLLPAVSGGTRIARLSSDQAFHGAVADLLIDVGTASGQRQHQVSVLQQGRPLALQQTAGLQPGTSASGTAGAPAGAAAGDTVLTVRKGDTLFSIAKRHAVPGISVYQMMAALHQANPQAFIDQNMNLLKAGGTLRVPDASALAALTDPQARRLFARHAQAFANRRATGSAAVADSDAAPADRGQVSAASSAFVPSSVAPRDQLRLSASGADAGTGAAAAAGQSGAGQAATADDTEAVRKGVQESQERVTQLEDNIRHLNQALQAQGPAAHQAAADGARAVGQTLADAAQAVADAAAVVAGGEAGSPDAAAAAANGTSGAVSGATTAGDAASQVAPGVGQSANDKLSSAMTASSDPTLSSSNQAKGAWLTNTMLAIITAVLALLVLIIAWLLRRANAKADERDGASGQITDDMIQEKLDRIDLDLNNPGDTDPPRGR